MSTRHYRVALADTLSGGDGNLRSDGTLWSHAATLGSFVYGATEFTIDADTLEQIVANFASGDPAKVPIDYEHETVKKDPATAAIPFTRKAGEIVEVRAVLADEQLLPEMRKQVDAERARRARVGLARDIDPLGLWVRWEPTTRALSMVKDREVTEMSVVIDFDHPNRKTGEGQGPTLLSVALTNIPFLGDMTPVAASGDGRTHPSASGGNLEESGMSTQNRLLVALAALLGKAPATEDEGIAELTAKVDSYKRDAEEGKTAKSGLAMLTAEIGETDPAKALAKVRELKALSTAAASAAETAAASAIDAFLKEHEGRIGSVPARDHFKATLAAEAKAAPTTKVAELPTAKVILSLKPAAALGQKTVADRGANLTDDRDVLLDRRARELVNTDAECKAALTAKGFTEAYRVALRMATKELTTGGAEGGTEVQSATK
jgi:hypothetical protein